LEKRKQQSIGWHGAVTSALAMHNSKLTTSGETIVERGYNQLAYYMGIVVLAVAKSSSKVATTGNKK